MKRFAMLAAAGLLTFSAANAQFRQRQQEPDTKTLKEAYKDYFMVGVAVNQRNISNPEEAAIVTR
ncbi:MAG: hypothetical protein MJZ60_06040 [Bacteroidaceae bacterium]|nr:hypothetical protein [Bacteroidaceae bacterium]